MDSLLKPYLEVRIRDDLTGRGIWHNKKSQQVYLQLAAWMLEGGLSEDDTFRLLKKAYRAAVEEVKGV